MKKRLLLLSFFGVFLACNPTRQTAATPVVSLLANPTPIFQKGDQDYACFRIPAIVVTPDGSVLAFAEARKNGCSDTGDIDLVMRKSTDQGQTWGPLQVIWDDGENVCGNPAPVVDKETGEIHLLITWNLGEDHESEIIDQTSQDTRRIFHLVSKNQGESWSGPREITEDVKLPHWTWYATGPVHGIQLTHEKHQGRLLIPCDHIEAESKKYYSHIIYSDDHGQTWQLGGTTPQDQVNECTVAELPNGDLMLNMRNYARKESQTRQVAISQDGGGSWQNQRFDPQLPEPRCQAALLKIERKGKTYLLFTNPAHDAKRLNMTLSISEDLGRTWPSKTVIHASHSAYSDLAELPNGQLIVLHEGGEESAYEAIFASLISLE
jgi:sialidase-1